MKKLILIITLVLLNLTNSFTESVFAQEVDVRTAIINGVENCQTKIDISKYNIDTQQAMDIYFELVNTNPNFFCVKEEVNVEYKGNIAQNLIVSYVYDKNQIQTNKVKMNMAIDNIVKMVENQPTNMDKAKAVHDYLINTTEYDYTFNQTTNYDLLVNGKGVCTGYAIAYKMIMDRLNIPCELVTSATMNHQWNSLNIDGKWYNVDLTWDENTTVDNISYDYFLKSDNYFTVLGYNGGNSLVKCDTDYKFI